MTSRAHKAGPSASISASVSVAVLLASLALTACGSNATHSSVSGTAATGLAIAHAKVSIKDSRGNAAQARTDDEGHFSFNPEGLAAPLMLQVGTDSGNLYAVVGGDEMDRHINITPFSHAISKMALGAPDDAALDAHFARAALRVSRSDLEAADRSFRQLLKDELGSVQGVSDDATNMRFVDFKPATSERPGDELDRLLTLFKPGIQGARFMGLNSLPEFANAVSVVSYDGVSDDLLTAGLGASGLAGAAPAYVNAASPTPAELRRNAIYANYRAVLDISPSSGYGRLYGPNVDKNGVLTPPGPTVGLIGGKEYTAYADDGSGLKNVTLLVQIPSTFDVRHPCMVSATSSGSRGIYGAIGSAGEWGLKHGCAVAYTDKGSGTGLYSFDTDQVNLRNGQRASRQLAGKSAIFAPQLSDATRVNYNASFPGRVAFKHAHSQQNPEQDWGKNTLQAVAFGFYALNQEYGARVPGRTELRRTITPANTIVIASSISNGAGAALLAAEQDRLGLIKGVAANEPQIQSHGFGGFRIEQAGVPVAAQAKPLYDYSSFAALYEPCIAATALASTGANRCNSLQAKGLLSGNAATDAPSLALLQADARSRMHGYGWLGDSDVLLNSPALGGNFGNSIFVGWSNLMVTATYAYAYGKFSVADHVCGFSFSNVDANGVPIAFGAAEATSFATQNGILGSLVYENSVGGARVFALGSSPSTQLQDQSLDGFLCLRSLATGVDAVSGAPLVGTLASQSQRVREGMAAVQASGNLHGKPAIIVQGRSDTLIPVNHASRAYLGLNAKAEGARSKLRYIEVTNANHFDALASSMPSAIVPLHLYLFRALDAVYAHLSSGTPLPPSQVVRTNTRVDNTTPITDTHVPPIAAVPAAADLVSVRGATVNIPN